VAKPGPMQIKIGVRYRHARLTLLLGFFFALIGAVALFEAFNRPKDSSAKRIQRLETRIGVLETRRNITCGCPFEEVAP